MTRVKICGLTTAEDRDVAIAAGADALGFIVDVSVDSPREIDARRAAELIADTPPFVSTVLVTMPETADDAIELLDRTGADAVQVHGLDPAAVAAIGSAGHRTVAAVDAADPERARTLDDAADALLVDSTDAAGGGGTGRTHDWNATRRLEELVDSPVILAGGLTPDNVAGAVRTVGPYGVDVATGVERTGGRKDHDAVRAFVDRARTATTGATP